MWFKQTVIVEVEYLEQQHGWLMVWLLSFASLFCMFCMESNLITIHMTCTHSSIKRTWKVLDMFGTSSSTYKVNCIYTRNRSMITPICFEELQQVYACCSTSMFLGIYVSIGMLSLPETLTTNIITLLVGDPYEPSLAPLYSLLFVRLWLFKTVAHLWLLCRSSCWKELAPTPCQNRSGPAPLLRVDKKTHRCRCDQLRRSKVPYICHRFDKEHIRMKPVLGYMSFYT